MNDVPETTDPDTKDAFKKLGNDIKCFKQVLNLDGKDCGVYQCNLPYQNISFGSTI